MTDFPDWPVQAITYLVYLIIAMPVGASIFFPIWYYWSRIKQGSVTLMVDFSSCYLSVDRYCKKSYIQQIQTHIDGYKGRQFPICYRNKVSKNEGW